MECSFCKREIKIARPNFCPYCSKPISDRKKDFLPPQYIYLGCKRKYFYPDVNLYPVENASRLCMIGESVCIEHEPENEFDSKAIVVKTHRGKKLGYLYRGRLQDMVLDFFERENDCVIAKVSYTDIENNKVQIALSFYRELTSSDIVKKFKVSVSERKYDEFFYNQVDDEISVTYDYDKCKYMLEEWGTLPERLEEYAEDFNYMFVILDDEIKESGSHSIQIGIIEKED